MIVTVTCHWHWFTSYWRVLLLRTLVSSGSNLLQRTVSFSRVVVPVHPPELAHHTPLRLLLFLTRFECLPCLVYKGVSSSLGLLQVSAVSFDVTSCCCTMTHERDRVMCWSFSLPVCGTAQAFAASVVARNRVVQCSAHPFLFCTHVISSKWSAVCCSPGVV